jgi:hypothetical protein
LNIFASDLSGVLGFDKSGNLFGLTGNTILKFTPAGTRTVFASGLNQAAYLAFEPSVKKLVNVSARGRVLTGEDVLIGGFVLGGSALNQNVVVLRAIGPSLSRHGIVHPLQDPILEVHNASGALIASNDNWQATQRAQIMAAGLAPSDPHESAIYLQLGAGSYTAVVRGANTTTGIALVEFFNIR